MSKEKLTRNPPSTLYPKPLTATTIHEGVYFMHEKVAPAI